jgi:hypothetical protein
MPLIIQKEWWTEDQIKNNPDHIFVFGDNEARVGRGGQAKYLRDYSNKIGIRTKRAPTHNPEDYWTDETFTSNIDMILEDFVQVEKALSEGKTVIFPEDGFGTGLAKLSINAPKTLNYINHVIETLKRIWI